MRILALGGTQFVGRAFAEAAIERGHDVTVLHRGKTPLPKGMRAKEIIADRDGGLGVIGNQKWDAVYDSCGYVPRIVRESASALTDHCKRYLFISTISVFGSELELLRPEKPIEGEKITNETYGPLKVECEDALTEAFGDRLTVVGPRLVAGPNDHTGRFPYWVDRFVRFGEVLTPDLPGAPLQQIDARDLANFCVMLLEKDMPGTFEVAGERSTFEAMINTCAAAGGGTPILVPPELIEANGIDVGSQLPLFCPPGTKLFELDCAAALAAGLTRRPLSETTADTLNWVLTLPNEKRSETKLTRAKEEEALAAVLV